MARMLFDRLGSVKLLEYIFSMIEIHLDRLGCEKHDNYIFSMIDIGVNRLGYLKLLKFIIVIIIQFDRHGFVKSNICENIFFSKI